MIDASLLTSSLSQAGALDKLQTLPQPNTQDVTRFESILNQDNPEKTGMTSLSERDAPLLQVLPNEMPPPTSVKEAVMNKIESVDSAYKGMLEQFSQMPTYTDFLQSSTNTTPAAEMRSYPEVGSTSKEGDWSKQMDAVLKDVAVKQETAINYQQGLTQWATKSQMWIAGMNIISSAVSQAASGFKTLFRAGG